MADVVILAFVVAYAVSGYRQGFFVSVLSLVGFVSGALAGIVLVPSLAGGIPPGVERMLVVLGGVVVAAWFGQFVGGMIGAALRDRVTWRPARLVDRALGAVAGGIAVALVVWFVAGALIASPDIAVSRAIARSRTLDVIDTLVPRSWTEFADDFRSTVAGSTFPRVFSGGAGIAQADPPSESALDPELIRRRSASIVKITGESARCQRGQEGSGAVIGQERVITNAHVVAGMDRPSVEYLPTGRDYRATLVLFDPKRDVAVLDVPGLPAPPLRLGAQLVRGDDAAVAGYPRNGPFRANAARIRRVVRADGEDIYGKGGARRQVYELYTTVQPGNSGGPVLDTQGRMVGLVFARSETDPDTGYALTLDEIRSSLQMGLRDDVEVSSGECTTT